jgi:hypothetical protein
MLLTVAELPEYQKASARLMGSEERTAIVQFLAARPKAGDLMEGTGGIRKLRWGREGRGKSGGVRVVYYFHSDDMPLYLLTVFAKNERANLSRGERNELAGLVNLLKPARPRAEGRCQGLPSGGRQRGRGQAALGADTGAVCDEIWVLGGHPKALGAGRPPAARGIPRVAQPDIA